MKNRFYINLLLAISSVLCSYAYGQPNLGNPLDKLPPINIDKQNTSHINIEKNMSNIVQNQSQQLNISNFNIQGVKSIPFESVSPIFEKIANKNISVNDLLNAANKVTLLYKKAGYILSFAYVPEQEFTTHNANIIIVEGYVKDIKITGKKDNNDVRILSILSSLKEDKPLTQKTFEYITNILALQPGIKVDLNIPSPTTIDGATIVEANIIQKKYDITLSLEAGNPEFQGIIAGTINSLTSLGDQLTLLNLQPNGNKSKKFYGLNYIVPLNNKGTIGKINASLYQENPNADSLLPLGYNSSYLNKNEQLSLSLNTPLILENKKNWVIGGGLYLNKEKQNYFPQPVFAAYPNLNIITRTTVLYGETNFIEATEKQSRQLGFSIYKGINTLGSYTENNNNDLSFTKIKAQFNQNFILPKSFELKLSGIYQYSNNNLPQSEKISFGNRLFGAAYQPGEIAGDKGWGISSEINYTIKPNYQYIKIVQPYLLLEKAQASNNMLSIPSNISSVSLGTKMNNQNYYSLNISISKPLGRLPIDGNRTRYYVSYAYQF